MIPRAIRLLLLLSVCSLAAIANAAGEKTTEATLLSIRPLAFIHAALRPEAAGELQVLIPANRNLHDYALSVSDIERLQAATTLFWLGADSEPFIARLQGRLGQGRQWVAVAESLPHAWLDTRQLPGIVAKMAAALAIRYPQEQATIDARAADFLAAVTAREAYWQQQLKPVANQPFLVGHNAFTAFAANLGLEQERLYRSGHDHGHAQAGLKELLVLQQQVQQGKIVCALQEPDVSFRDLTRRYPGLRVGHVEPMGAAIPVSPQAYIQFFDATAQAFRHCLQPGATP